MSTPRIWEALQSSNLQLLTEVLFDRVPLGVGSMPIAAVASLLIENNERREGTTGGREGRPGLASTSQPDDAGQEQVCPSGFDSQRIHQLARDLYFAISDVYEDVEQHVDVSADGDQPNWAMSAIQVWEPLLERAQAVLGLSKDKPHKPGEIAK